MPKITTGIILWLIPIILGIFLISIYLGGKPAADLLKYQRALILDGEYWRLITAHLVHFGRAHLLLNGAGLLLVWFIVGNRFSAREWGVLIFFVALTTSLCLLFFEPQLQQYVGLSGVLHGSLLAGVLIHFRNLEDQIIAAVIVLKLIFEQISGSPTGSEELIGGPVLVHAHLYGALAAGCYVFVRKLVFKALPRIS